MAAPALREASPRNYTMHSVAFRVVREPGTGRRLSTPAEVAALAAHLVADDAREHFWVLMTDVRHRLVAAHEVSVGTLSASLVSPREVFGPALRVLGVASVILVHNHPSGDPAPSTEDIRITRQLAEAASILDLRVHDHVILGSPGERWVSLAEMGVL